jgi:hypothetical protein
LIVTGHSDNVTAHSDNQSKSVTIKSESAVTIAEPPVTLFRNQRSRWVGIRTSLALRTQRRATAWRCERRTRMAWSSPTP